MRPLTEAQMRQSFFDRLRPEAECLVWAGSRDGRGYGKVYVGNDLHIKAHRYAWHIAYGGIPAGMHVLHRCDNPPCCKLDHLFLGTHADNMADMARKGRAGPLAKPEAILRGEDSNSTLTEQQVREAIESDETSRDIATRFGVAPATIVHARAGLSWAHLDIYRPTSTERQRRRIDARRARIEALRGAGLTARQIAEVVGRTRQAVEADLHFIRLRRRFEDGWE
jgi:hypothetical protein